MPDPDQAGLRAIAREVAAHYAAMPGVTAVLLCGSVARGWADPWSDIELVVCSDLLPLGEAREQVALRAGGTGRRVFPGGDGVEEEFVVRGVKVDLAFMTGAGLGRINDDVTIRADPSPRSHALVAGIRDAVVLYGETAARHWREQAARYPEGLRITLIRHHLVFGPQWWLEMLADRDDVLALHAVLGRVSQALVGIVLALNRTYAVSDSGKWAMRQVSGLEITPERFGARLRQLLTSEPGAAVTMAGTLIAETIALVRTHAPEVAVDEVARRVGSRRAGA